MTELSQVIDLCQIIDHYHYEQTLKLSTTTNLQIIIDMTELILDFDLFDDAILIMIGNAIMVDILALVVVVDILALVDHLVVVANFGPVNNLVPGQ